MGTTVRTLLAGIAGMVRMAALRVVRVIKVIGLKTKNPGRVAVGVHKLLLKLKIVQQARVVPRLMPDRLSESDEELDSALRI